MGYGFYKSITDADISALITYLRSLPPQARWRAKTKTRRGARGQGEWGGVQDFSSLEKPNGGTVKPNMGMNESPSPATSMADALFSKVCQRVLTVLIGAPDRSFCANEVTARGAVQHRGGTT